MRALSPAASRPARRVPRGTVARAVSMPRPSATCLSGWGAWVSGLLGPLAVLHTPLNSALDSGALSTAGFRPRHHWKFPAMTASDYPPPTSSTVVRVVGCGHSGHSNGGGGGNQGQESVGDWVSKEHSEGWKEQMMKVVKEVMCSVVVGFGGSEKQGGGGKRERLLSGLGGVVDGGFCRGVRAGGQGGFDAGEMWSWR
jgi:hypothetical protein